jgi:glycosyltransferase involved in cell wall biosynthesis
MTATAVAPDPAVVAVAPAVVAVVPALNAAASVGAVVAGVRRHLGRVLVVDDGSIDGTAERAAAAGAEVIRHPSNRGKGTALLTAFHVLLRERQRARASAARGSPAAAGVPATVAARAAEEAADAAFAGALTLDADGQHEPDDIPAFLHLFGRARPAIIVGSRARYFADMWWPRRAMNRFSSAALRFFAGADLPDSQSGFRLYDARFLEVALGGAGGTGGSGPGARTGLGRRYEAEMELLMRAARPGLPIASVPIRLTVADGRATSHYRPLVDTFRIVGAVLRERLWGGGPAGPAPRGPADP